MTIEQDHPSLGRIRMPNLPFRFSGYEPPVPPVAPLIGQHNRDVAASLGYSGEEIEALTAAGVLYEEEAVVPAGGGGLSSLSERRQQDVQDVLAVRRVVHHRRPQVRRPLLAAREQVMHGRLRSECFERGERRLTPRAYEPVPQARVFVNPALRRSRRRSE